jgi:hypothetical protein
MAAPAYQGAALGGVYPEQRTARENLEGIFYFPNGQPGYHLVMVPCVLNGDSVLELRTTYFKLAAPTDTACVEHRFAKLHENKDAGKSLFLQCRRQATSPQGLAAGPLK